MISLQGLIAKYTEQPPDFQFWGSSGTDSEEPEPDTNMPLWWNDYRRVPMPAIGGRLEALFYPVDDPKGEFGSPGEWFPGTIVGFSADKRTCNVLFDDGERTTFPYSDIEFFNDVRMLSSPEDKIEYMGGRFKLCRMQAPRLDPEEGGFGKAGSLRPSTGPGPWETWLKTYLPDLLLTIFRAARLDPAQVNKELLDKLKYFDDDGISDADTPAQPKRARPRASDA
jgi:hypothetical protein